MILTLKKYEGFFFFATLSSQSYDLATLLEDTVHGNFTYFYLPARHTYIP